MKGFILACPLFYNTIKVEKTNNIDYNYDAMSKRKLKIAGKNEAEKSKYDSAWKKVIRELFESFLEFFFPEIYQAVDFTKEIDFLDKELSEIHPDSTPGDRIADVLVKVHLKDGTVKYICVVFHIEVQGAPRSNFMERMFIYFYRAFDKEKEEKIPVISVAILTDDNENYRPDEYFFSLFGFELRMKIPIVKIIDFKLKKELRKKLETSNNPMSLVVKAQLKSHEVKKADDNTKFEVTKELIRQCYKHGYAREETHVILNFYDWVIRLPGGFKDRIKEVIKKAEEEFKMEYVPIWERDAQKIGEKRGEKRGRKEAKLETARKLIKRGVDIDIIAEATGFPKQEIEKLGSKSH
jgi:hypothetical protein